MMKIKSILILGLSLLALSSCRKQDGPGGDGRYDGQTVLSVNFPGVEPAALASKAAEYPANQSERFVDTLQAFMFDHTTAVLEGVAMGEYGTDRWYFAFGDALDLSSKTVDVVFVANSCIPATAYTVGTTTLTQFKQLKVYQSNGYGNHPNYDMTPPLMMLSATTLSIEEGVVNPVGNIVLHRLAARIDITNADATGKIRVIEARLVNRANTTTVGPEPFGCTDFRTGGTYYNHGYCTVHNVAGCDCPPDYDKMWSHLYAYENPNSGTKTQVQIYYMLEGQKYSVVADFKQADGSVLPIVRNFRYEFRVSLMNNTPQFDVQVMPWGFGALDGIDLGGLLGISAPTYTSGTAGTYVESVRTIYIDDLEHEMTFAVESDSDIDITATDAADDQPATWLTATHDVVSTRAWAPAEGGYKGTMTVTVDPYTATDAARTARVTVESADSTVTLVFIQSPVPTSQANCFMVAPGAGVSFNACKRGNETTEELATQSIGVVWQSEPNLIAQTDYSTINKRAVVQTGTSGKAGNAVVAAYDGPNGTGNIIWSWHIWVTNYQPERYEGSSVTPNTYYDVPGGQVHVYGISSYTNTAAKPLMDRALGATVMAQGFPAPNDAPGLYAPVNTLDNALSTYGLYYQWGRKDPFPQWDGGFYGPKTNAGLISIYNAAGQEIPHNQWGSKGYYMINIIEVPKTNGTTLDYSIAHPLEYIGTNGHHGYNNNNGDWYSEVAQNNELWQSPLNGGKGLYDPCPKGWRVPPISVWNEIPGEQGGRIDNFVNHSLVSYFPFYVDFAVATQIYEGWNSGIPVNATAGRLYDGSQPIPNKGPQAGNLRSWFPFAGNGNDHANYTEEDKINIYLGGSNVNQGSHCRLWSSTSYYVSGLYGETNEDMYIDGIALYTSNSSRGMARAHAQNVRCVKE